MAQNIVESALEAIGGLEGGALQPNIFYPGVANVSAGDLFVLGADTYEFVDVAAPPDQVTNDAYIGVEIGAALADSMGYLADAINGSYTPSVVIYKTDGLTPAATAGTENVLALYSPASADEILLWNASAPGGTKTTTLQNIACSKTFTDAAAAFIFANMNLTGSVAVDTSFRAVVERTVTALDVTLGYLVFDFPFTPKFFLVQVYAASGVNIPAVTFGTDLTGSMITVVVTGGAPLVNTDVVKVLAIS